MSRADQSVVISRRTVVRVGAKLAYAAPLVAASMELHQGRADAAISGPPTDERALQFLGYGAIFCLGGDGATNALEFGGSGWVPDELVTVTATSSFRGGGTGSATVDSSGDISVGAVGELFHGAQYNINATGSVSGPLPQFTVKVDVC